MSFIIVDVESDGPIPPKFSMICFGAVLLTEDLGTTFYGRVKPISGIYDDETLAISKFTREDHESFDEPKWVMESFRDWLKTVSKDKPVFVSDNPAYDWQWINYYFHTYLGSNPFGYSARRIGDLYCGMKGDVKAKWKHLRKTRHTHHPVDDAKGNAEALLEMKRMGLNIKI